MLSRKSSQQPAGAAGHRAYVVGDVHGRLDLLDELLDKIHAELEARPSKRTLLLFVGDLIDRGPCSAQVLERLRTYRHPGVTIQFILGNHEEVLLRILAGEGALVAQWLKFGGAETLASYGVDAEPLRTSPDEQAVAAIRASIPDDHTAFLESFADTFRFGDYLVVHAGIRPGVELDQQRQSDLRWIREPFLMDDSDHGFVVVHGHTIGREVEERPNRIGIDTGAYRSGRLTALAIDGREHWYLETAPAEDAAVSATH